MAPDERPADTPLPTLVVVSDLTAVAIGTPGELDGLDGLGPVVPASLLQVVTGALQVSGSAHEAAAALTGRLVMLTEESARALQLGAVSSGGHTLGVTAGASGRFAHVVRFDAASGIAAASAAAGIVAAVALQAQLARIERHLADIRSDVNSLARHGELAVEARVVATLRILDDLAEDVADGGFRTIDEQTLIDLRLDTEAAYEQTARVLEDLAQQLAALPTAIGARGIAAARIVERQGLPFWLAAHMHADVALSRWRWLSLIHQSELHPTHVERETAQFIADVDARERRIATVLRGIEEALTAARTTRRWDSLRPLARRRLASRIGALERVLDAYAVGRGVTPVPRIDAARWRRPERPLELPMRAGRAAGSAVVGATRSIANGAARGAGSLTGAVRRTRARDDDEGDPSN